MDDVWRWLRIVFLVLRDAVQGFSEKGDTMLGGAIAFFTVLSAAPLLVIAVGVAGLIFGMEEARHEVLVNVRELVGPGAEGMAERLMDQAREPVTGGVAAAAGLAVLIYGSTRLFVHLQRGLNHVMGVRVRPTQGLKRAAQDIVKQRAKSFAMVLACGLTLTLLLAFRTAVTVASTAVDRVADVPVLWNAIELTVSFSLLALLLAAIYRVIPDVHLAWRDVWLGGIVTALLLGIGTIPIGWFLARATTASAYGAAGTLVAILLFVYYASVIFFLGAEITAAWARRCGRGVRPKSYAVRVVAEPDEQAAPSA